MAIKQSMKLSEARILTLLDMVTDNMRHTSGIATKLNMDYAYTIKILNSMLYKKWVLKRKTQLKTLYYIRNWKQIKVAKKLIFEDNEKQKMELIGQ